MLDYDIKTELRGSKNKTQAFSKFILKLPMDYKDTMLLKTNENKITES